MSSTLFPRNQILKWAQRNKRFAAIDRAIGRDSFKFVTLLRLSPLLPLSASNYLYGLTSVKLGPYVLVCGAGVDGGVASGVALLVSKLIVYSLCRGPSWACFQAPTHL